MASYTYTLQAIKSAGIDKDNPNTNYSTSGTWDIKNHQAYNPLKGYEWTGLLVGFEPASGLPLAGKIITEIKIYLYVNSEIDAIELDVFANSNFTENSITHNTCERGDFFTFSFIWSGSDTIPGYVELRGVYEEKNNADWLSRLALGTRFKTDDEGYGYINVDTSRGAHPPYIEISASDSIPTATIVNPSGTYEDRRANITMSWAYANLTGGVQKSYQIQYKDSSHASWTNLTSATSGATSYSVPASTFSAGLVNWRIKVTSQYDVESEWVEASFEAINIIPAVTTSSPKGTYEDNASVKLSWIYSNAAGGAQKSYQIQYKDISHENWTALISATSGATSYNVPAGTFSAGEVSWRVKVTNLYDNVSEWSAAAVFVAQGVPLAPALTVNASVRPTMSWVCVGQQAYEVRIGEDTQKFFGTARTYSVKEYLADGNITVGVRIQNEFGLWSAWSLETITVANTPGDSITLTVQATDKARLAWTDTTHTAYYVYRDDVAIAKVTDTTYTDHVAVGRHIYKVRGVDGNDYSMSNAATCTLRVDCPMIAALDALTWLKLKHTASQERAIGMSASQDVTFQYYSGRTLPLAESGGRVSKSHSFSVAFESPADAAAFEALLGKTVVYKDQHNRLFIGPLMAYESSTGIFFAEYSCTIMQTDNREAVDYD